MIAAGLSIALVALFVWFLILAADKPEEHAGWFYAVSGAIIVLVIVIIGVLEK